VEGGGDPVVVEIRDVPVLYLAATIRHLRLVDPEGVTEMLHLAGNRLAERGIAPAGPPTALFRSGDGNDTHLVEAGFPVTAGVEGDELLRVTLYPASAAATVDHVGSYDGLHVTAQRFIASALGQGLRFAQPIRIEYVEPDVRARIVWPLASS
jgi:effector-binding domain-containing protein